MCRSFIESKYAQQLIDKLRKMIDANMPIIYIDSCDYARIDAIISEARIDKSKEGTVIKTWDPTTDGTEDGGKDKDLHTRLETFLRHFYDSHTKMPNGKQCFIVLKCINDLIDYPTIKMLLINIAQLRIYQSNLKDLEDNPVRDNTTIFIVSSVVNIPKELEMYVSYLDIPFPKKEEISRLIEEHLAVNNAPEIDENIKDKLIEYLLGSTEYEIDSILDMAMSVNGELNAQDNNLIKEQKRERVRRSGLLDYIDLDSVSEYDVGGLKYLQEYIDKERYIIKNLEKAKDFGVPSPKGIFLWGEPGCGKSLSAKVIAKRMNVPLLKLDMGSMLGSLQGQAEARMRKALRIADATAPCILWIDEIEKGFNGVNGVGGSSDSTTHMFGYFLTWLQEKESAVYVIATANHPEYLPKEVLRKGRFDQMFYLGLPGPDERKQIFGINFYKFFKKNDYWLTEIYEKSTINGEKIRIKFDDNKTNPCNLEYYIEACPDDGITTENWSKTDSKKWERKEIEEYIIKSSESWSGAEIEATFFSTIKDCFRLNAVKFKDKKNLKTGIKALFPMLLKTIKEQEKNPNNKRQNEEKEQNCEDLIWLKQHSLNSSTGEPLLKE